MSNQCACGEREECDHSCMPDVIDGVCSHCGQRAPGLPILPAGMTNELFYKEQAEYWRQIASQKHMHDVAQAVGKLGDPHPHWSVEAENTNYPKTVEEWDPHQDPVGEHLARAEKRLRVAMDRDDPRAPDEMAIVSRWDLTTLVHDWWHKCAVFDLWRKERAEKAAAVQRSSAEIGEVNARPAQYCRLPNGVSCKCLKLWREADGSYWCCNPQWLEQADHERHEQEIRALAATNGEDHG